MNLPPSAAAPSTSPGETESPIRLRASLKISLHSGFGSAVPAVWAPAFYQQFEIRGRFGPSFSRLGLPKPRSVRKPGRAYGRVGASVLVWLIVTEGESSESLEFHSER
jgi:hypothetical protein